MGTVDWKGNMYFMEREGKEAKTERVSDPSIGGERREWLATIRMSQNSVS